MEHNECAPPQLDAADGAKEMPWGTDDIALAQLGAGAKPARPKPARYLIHGDPANAVELTLSGRAAWTLNRLIWAVPMGLTAMDCPPGVRLAAHIADLRASGIPIDKAVETHGGPFPGHHARYRLATLVERIGDGA